MQSIKLIGADVGNDSLKIMCEDGKKYEIMNAIAPGYSRRVIGEEKKQPINLLDVTINGERSFVGGIAYTFNRGDLREKTSKDIKATDEDTITLLVTGLAYALYDPLNPVKTENIGLGTLLPTEEYFNDDLFKKFESSLKNKSFEVKFNSPVFKKADITINILDIDIKPEGTAAALAYSYNIDGSGKEGNENIEEETQLGIDIGSQTTDITVIDHGEPRAFIGIPLGTAEPLDKIIADLDNLEELRGTHIELSRHQLEYYLRKKVPLKINSKNGIIDISEKLNEFEKDRFSNFTRLLINRIYKELSLNGINTEFFDRVNMVGGGSIDILDQFKKMFNMGNIVLVEDARFANAKGALTSIALKGNLKEAAADEVLNNTEN